MNDHYDYAVSILNLNGKSRTEQIPVAQTEALLAIAVELGRIREIVEASADASGFWRKLAETISTKWKATKI